MLLNLRSDSGLLMLVDATLERAENQLILLDEKYEYQSGVTYISLHW